MYYYFTTFMTKYDGDISNIAYNYIG